MRTRITERRNRVAHHRGAASTAHAIAAGELPTDPPLIDETRTKETV
jgi:hypothetical protein